MNIIINEYQYRSIFSEGKKATIYHKAAPGTTNQENLIDGSYTSNQKKINLLNYLNILSNKLVSNKTILFDVDGNILLYVSHDKYKVFYIKSDGTEGSNLLRNIFIIP